MCCVLLGGPSFSQSQPRASSDSSHARRISILPLPIFYYTPETGFAGGGALLGLLRPAAEDTLARPSSLLLDLIYTQKGQIIVEIAPDIFLDGRAYRFTGWMQFSRYPLKFYGIGNTTPESLEEPYTSRSFQLLLDALRSIAGDFSAGISVVYDSRTFSELQSNGLLRPGTITGSAGGKTVGAGVIFHWDTRDNIFSPGAGRFYQASLRASTPKIGSDFEFTYLVLDLREYFAITEASVLAMQAMATLTSGDVPFYFLAELGGSDIMRGYYEGRYRDKKLLAAQIEYRFPIYWRFGGVAFAGAGDVAPALGQFSLSGIKPSIGFGLRYLFDPAEKLTIRIDLGYGRQSSGLYITANQAF